MYVLGFALLLNCRAVFASSLGHELNMDLSLNGKHVSSPRVLVREGAVATISQKTNTEVSFIEVITTQEVRENAPVIRMKFIVGTMDQAGRRTVIAKPQVLAHENSPARITYSGKNGGERFSLSVLANRKSL